MKKFLATLLIVACALTASFVYAAIQTFDGKGEWHTNDDDKADIAKARAQQRAQLDAQKKAGVFLKTFSRTVDMELVDDEVNAVTANIIELVGDVQFDKKIIPLSDQSTTILYPATLQARIHPDSIFDFVGRVDKGKIVSQNNSLQDLIQRNDEQAAALTEQFNQAETQDELDELRRQLDEADREFLANQKFEDGLKCYYAKDYDGAIRLYNEALDLNPNWDFAYNNLAMAYNDLGQYERAIADYDKAIELNPNDADFYFNRGGTYKNLKQFDRAIQDYNQALKLNPNDADTYNNRGFVYDELEQYDLAIADYDKALELNPKLEFAYNNRAIAFVALGNIERAIADATKAIQLNPNYANAYYVRGICYQELGDEAKAQADLDKAKELGLDD